MKIQTTLSRRAKITRVAIVTGSVLATVAVLFVAMQVVNATSGCQATYIDHTSKGGVTKAACVK